jgi:tetratricopeptide (TPR) repeat protein
MMQNSPRFSLNIKAKFFSAGVRQVKAEKYQAGLTSLEKTLKCKPSYADAWSQRGLALGNLGRHKEAIASFDKALVIRPNASLLWHNRSIALGKLGRYKEAINGFDRSSSTRIPPLFGTTGA